MITFDFENKEIRQDGRKTKYKIEAIRFLIFAMMFCMEMNMMSSGII